MADVSEEDRLEALRGYGVLDTPKEAAFDEIAQAAAVFCGAPMAAVSLVEDSRQWFKAEVGLGVRETPRAVSFCQHAMLGDELYVVADAQAAALFAGNPLVVGDPKVRFYAGAPIRTPEGAPLGALCVIDTQARPGGLTADQANLLRVLARQVEAQLELRRAAEIQGRRMVAATAREQRLITALTSAQVGWWDWDIATGTVFGSADLARDRELDPATTRQGVPQETMMQSVHPGDRLWLREALGEAIETGAPFREEYRLLTASGEVRWTSARGRCLRGPDGKPWRFPGVAIDITDRKLTEERLRDSHIGRELAMQAAQLGRFDHSPSRGARYYDARALEMFGLTVDEVQTLDTVMRHVHPGDRQALADKLAEAVDANRSGPLRHTFRFIRPRTGEQRWINVAGRSQFADGQCTRFMGVFDDVTEAKQAEAQRRMLVGELNHRMKNTLAIVMSLVTSSLRNAADPDAAREELTGRIMALSRANDLLTAENWSAASAAQIVEGMIATLSLPRERLELTGEAVPLGPRPALQLALALHELATNAVKYGALSNDTGRVALHWAVQGQGEAAVFTFDWNERGGPTVTAPTHKGFGSRLVRQATASAFGGAVEYDYLPTGVRWSIRAPLQGLAELGRSAQ